MPPRFSFSTELNIKCECTICPVRLAQAVLYISTIQGRKEGKARKGRYLDPNMDWFITWGGLGLISYPASQGIKPNQVERLSYTA
jgi:hypothetical protein